MRFAVAVSVAILIAATSTLADPAPEPVGSDVMQRLRQARSDPAGTRMALDRLARAGRADAAEALGEMLQSGMGAPVDRSAACGYFALASGKRGDATHNLALCYEQGAVGAAPDLARAAQLYEQAANLGFAKSNCALGNFYVFGQGVSKNVARGLALCRIAAEAGVADAQADVGNIYFRGDGITKDAVEARRWYGLAVEQRQHQAARTLGQMFWNGDGGIRDRDEAVRLWRISADAGDIYAPNLIADALFARVMAENFKLDDPARLTLIDEAVKWYGFAVTRDTRPATSQHAATSIRILDAARKATISKPLRAR